MEYEENPVEKLFREQRDRIEAEKDAALEEKDAALVEKDESYRHAIRSMYYDFHISKDQILVKNNGLTSERLDEILA